MELVPGAILHALVLVHFRVAACPRLHNVSCNVHYILVYLIIIIPVVFHVALPCGRTPKTALFCPNDDAAPRLLPPETQRQASGNAQDALDRCADGHLARVQDPGVRLLDRPAP